MAREPKRSASVVTVACKLPQGLHIHLKDGDGIVQKVIKLHGSASPYAIGGYGLTQGVPAADWTAVQEQHADALWLKNEFVFANNDADSVADQVEERKDVLGGFEPIDPASLPGNIQRDGADDPAAK